MSKPKNVLLITSDEFRYDCIGATGNPVIRTPNLDALASEGVIFSKYFVQACPCGPSRMCLYTGRYLCSTRSVNNMTPLADAEDNLGMYLRNAGYAPVISGYNDYAVDPRILPADDPRASGLDYDNFLPGFDVLLDHEHDSPEYFNYLRSKGYPEEICTHERIHMPNVPPEGRKGHLASVFPAHYREEDSECRFHTLRAIDYLRNASDSPWFLNVNFIKPHGPWICAAPYHEMYRDDEMPEPVRRFEELKDPHPYLRMMYRAPMLVDQQELREFQRCYYGMITEFDVNLGILFQALKDTGQWDNTIIAFISDHGEYMGDHYRTDKGHFHDAPMHVPCIIRDPSPEADATRGQILDAFCESVDITPTICDWMNVPIPDRVQGMSLVEQIRGNPAARRKQEIHYEYDFRWESKMVEGADPDQYLLWVVRDDDFKYVQFGLESMPPLLFDLRNDPGEFNNLAALPEYAPKVAEYCQRLLRWRMKNEDQRMEHWAYPLR